MKKSVLMAMTVVLSTSSAFARLTPDIGTESAPKARYILVNNTTGTACYQESSQLPSLKGAQQANDVQTSQLQEAAANLPRVKAITRCQGQEKMVMDQMTTQMNTAPQTAGLPLVLAGYYFVCTGVNAATMWANTARQEIAFFVFLGGAAVSLTACGPVTGLNYMIYLAGDAVYNRIKGSK